jgi:hypothetical protein
MAYGGQRGRQFLTRHKERLHSFLIVKQIRYFTWQLFFSNFLPGYDSVHESKHEAQYVQYMKSVVIYSFSSYPYGSFSQRDMPLENIYFCAKQFCG